jgi:hypothetical protein
MTMNKYSAQDYTFQFITVTAGVLIALLINGMVEWNHDRALVAAAHATMAREIDANKKELEASIAAIEITTKRFDDALKFARELIGDKTTTLNELHLELSLADISSTAWHTAERTGALSLMDYEEVQRYSRLYDLQELFLAQQQALLEQLTTASSIFTGDFDIKQPNVKDLELFRERVTQLSGAYNINQQMAKQLADRYTEALKR